MPEKPNRLIKKKEGIPNAEVAKGPKTPMNILRRPLKRTPMERVQAVRKAVVETKAPAVDDWDGWRTKP